MHIQPNHVSILGLTLLTAGLSPLRAEPQRADTQADTQGSVRAWSHGVVEDDGVLFGLGADYRIRFDASGASFEPAFGSGAARTLPVRFTTESIRRGDVLASFGAHSAPPARRETHRVVYPRGSVVERYDIAPTGVEQSFVFAALPAGSGDLVVRIRVETELTGAAHGHGLSFTAPGIGAVHYGGVTGFDARGRRVAGRARLAGEHIELSLPAGFVDDATYPLVLDPFITTQFDVGTVGDFEQPDVAYDATNDLYLVVWQRRFSATDVDVLAQRVAPNGTLVGSIVLVKLSPGIESESPRVANVNQRDRFVVVWSESQSIRCRSVDAATGATSAEAMVATASGTIQPFCPDIGGEATIADDDAMAVWLEINTAPPFTRELLATQIQVLSDGTCQPFSSFGLVLTIASGSVDTCPTISKSAGAAGRFLVTWERGFGVENDSEIFGAVLSRNQALLDPLVQITDNIIWESSPENDGDGDQWLVVYEQEAFPGSGDLDIAATPVFFNTKFASPSAEAQDEVVLEGDLNDDERNPGVACLGASCIVTYSDWRAANEYDVYAHSVDLFSGLDCEGQYLLDGGTSDADWARAASQKSGDPSAGEAALLVWESSDVLFDDGDIEARMFEAKDGIVTDLGGGCGRGGRAYASGALVGNENFTVYARNSGGSSWLILSPSTIDFGCGSCVLVPDPYVAYSGYVFGSVFGNAGLPIPIPDVAALAGLEFYVQFFVSYSSDPSCPKFDGDFSNALAIEIE